MAANPNQPAETSEAPDAHLSQSMGWVMPVWLISFILVVVFGIVTYIVAWFMPRG